MSAPAAFLEWARAARAPLPDDVRLISREDLAPLRRMIGDARFVALGEASHDGAEPLQLRNRLLQHLVEESGFTAIAIESGLVESRRVQDYVLGGPGELAEIMAQGFSWTFGRFPENRELVEWLRTYNESRGIKREIRFYGFDVSGSPGSSAAARGVDTALRESLAYLPRVDGAAAERWAGQPFPESVAAYLRMRQSDKDALTAMIAGLIAAMECHEAQYINASTPSEYEWNYRAAIGARQVDDWLRIRCAAGEGSDAAPGALSGAALSAALRAEESRDRVQADNLEWILRQEGPQGKVLVFGHRFHLSRAPVTRCLLGEATEVPHYSAGTYLKRRFGEQLITIGLLVGESGAARTSEASIDGFAREVGVGSFALDVRHAPPAATDWLNTERLSGHSVAARRQCFKLRVGEAFDVVLYMDRVS
jgi:erythromycin esterase